MEKPARASSDQGGQHTHGIMSMAEVVKGRPDAPLHAKNVGLVLMSIMEILAKDIATSNRANTAVLLQ